MNIKLEKIDLKGSSKIEIDFYLGTSDRTEPGKVTIIKYSGIYRIGSQGDADATYMYAMGKAAVSLCNSCGVISDWSDLDYQWGDLLEMVLDIGADRYIDETFPNAVVVGPKCREAVRTLLLGLDSNEPIDSIEFIFEDLELAFKYIESKLRKVI